MTDQETGLQEVPAEDEADTVDNIIQRHVAIEIDTSGDKPYVPEVTGDVVSLR